MDEVDLANDHAEMHLKHALNAVPKPKPVPPGNGRCWVCAIDVKDGRRFCCRDCADEWERSR